MLAELLISIIILLLSIMAYIVKTEGVKLSVAGIVGLFGLTWGFIANSWSNFTEFIMNPAIGVILGDAHINLYTVSAIMVFFAWIFVLFIAIINIILTFNKGSVKIFQNWTESESDKV